MSNLNFIIKTNTPNVVYSCGIHDKCKSYFKLIKFESQAIGKNNEILIDLKDFDQIVEKYLEIRKEMKN